MKFSLAPFFLRALVPSQATRLVRYRPVIHIEVTGPKGTASIRVLIDTGSDDIVFPWDIAAQIGIDLSGASGHSLVGAVSATPSTIAFAPVILFLADGSQSARWRTTVGFTKSPMRIALFGIAGGLEHFRFTMYYTAKEVELVAEPTLPTTQDPKP